MKFDEKNSAKKLRKSGYSFKEISELIGISKSTASLWTRNIKLSETAIARLKSRVTNGQIISAENKRKRTREILDSFYKDSGKELNALTLSKSFLKIIASVFYLCEGGKYDNRMIQFTNSDPILIEVFLKLLRNNYPITESKFRACLHIHGYHDADKQITYWSKITKISKSQFIKPHLKINTKKRIRDGYQGCMQIRYYDSNVSRQLIMSGKAFLDYYRSLV